MYPNWQNVGAGYVAPQGQMYDPNYQQQMYQWYYQQQPDQTQMLAQQWDVTQQPLVQGDMTGMAAPVQPAMPNTQLPPLPNEPQPPLPPSKDPDTLNQIDTNNSGVIGTKQDAGMNPAPPVEPPRDEKPPLPPDPPPEEDKKNTLVPKDPDEKQKLSSLQQQAAQWQQQQQQQQLKHTQQGAGQWQYPNTGAQWPNPGQAWQTGQYAPQAAAQQRWDAPAMAVPAATVTAQTSPEIEAIAQEEKDFELQYKQWEQQYNDWREQNKNHPNKELFTQYEQQFSQYREQMEIKKKDIMERKEKAHLQLTMKQPPPQDYQSMPPSQHGFPPPVMQGIISKPDQQQQGLPANSAMTQPPGMAGSVPSLPRPMGNTPSDLEGAASSSGHMGSTTSVGQQRPTDTTAPSQLGYTSSAGPSTYPGSRPNMSQSNIGNTYTDNQNQGFSGNDTSDQQQDFMMNQSNQSEGPMTGSQQGFMGPGPRFMGSRPPMNQEFMGNNQRFRGELQSGNMQFNQQRGPRFSGPRFSTPQDSTFENRFPGPRSASDFPGPRSASDFPGPRSASDRFMRPGLRGPRPGFNNRFGPPGSMQTRDPNKYQEPPGTRPDIQQDNDMDMNDFQENDEQEYQDADPNFYPSGPQGPRPRGPGPFQERFRGPDHYGGPGQSVGQFRPGGPGQQRLRGPRPQRFGGPGPNRFDSMRPRYDMPPSRFDGPMGPRFDASNRNMKSDLSDRDIGNSEMDQRSPSADNEFVQWAPPSNFSRPGDDFDSSSQHKDDDFQTLDRPSSKPGPSPMALMDIKINKPFTNVFSEDKLDKPEGDEGSDEGKDSGQNKTEDSQAKNAEKTESVVSGSSQDGQSKASAHSQAGNVPQDLQQSQKDSQDNDFFSEDNSWYDQGREWSGERNNFTNFSQPNEGFDEGFADYESQQGQFGRGRGGPRGRGWDRGGHMFEEGRGRPFPRGRARGRSRGGEMLHENTGFYPGVQRMGRGWGGNEQYEEEQEQGSEMFHGMHGRGFPRGGEGRGIRGRGRGPVQGHLRGRGRGGFDQTWDVNEEMQDPGWYEEQNEEFGGDMQIDDSANNFEPGSRGMFDRGRGMIRGRPMGRVRGFGRGQEFDRGRGFGRGQEFDRGRGFGRGLEFDRGRGFGRGQEFSRGRGLGRGQEIDRGRGLGRGHEFDRGRGFGRGQHFQERFDSEIDSEQSGQPGPDWPGNKTLLDRRESLDRETDMIVEREPFGRGYEDEARDFPSDIPGNREPPKGRPDFLDRDIDRLPLDVREHDRRPDDYRLAPYGRYPDERDPYFDRRDPFVDRRDPYYDRYMPYSRPPFADFDRRRPYDDPYLSERYRDIHEPPTQEFKPFQVAESIDYGHKSKLHESSDHSRESSVGLSGPVKVIDYSHGNTKDKEKNRSPSRNDFPKNSEDDRKKWNDRDRFPRDSESQPADKSSRKIHESKIETTKIEDILMPPGRLSRPPQIVLILRGLPGAGKSYVSKLIKDREVAHGGSAPRMLCLDDYFMVEVDRLEPDAETGKKVKKKVLEYEYEAGMEDSYRQNMYKSFKKTIDDGFFPFIIVDAINDRVKHFEDFWSYAKSRGFQVYVAEVQADLAVCVKRNTHKRSQKELDRIKKKWESTPKHFIRLDIRTLLQEDSITEVEMEDSLQEASVVTEKEKKEEKKVTKEDDEIREIYKKSKWEIDHSEEQLDKLDGIKKRKRSISPQSMDDFLQLSDDYFTRESEPGKKRVRWADIEERKTQTRRREIGFIVGQTQRDWERITDHSFADKQLNKTKYI